MLNIILACSAGMSTSLLVERMKVAAIQRNLLVNIHAYGVAEINEDLEVEKVDCVLVGPQARYGMSQVEEFGEQHNCPVSVIPPDLYGTFNGEKVLDFALELIG